MGVHSMPTTLALVETELSAARQELARTTEQVADARAAVDAANGPVQRLQAVAARLAELEARLAASRSEDDQRLAEWLTGGEGDRPQPSHETLRLEAELRECRREHGAAVVALPARQEEAAREVAELTRRASAQRSAMYRVTLEALGDYVERRLRPAIAAAMEYEAVARGLRAGSGQRRAPQQRHRGAERRIPDRRHAQGVPAARGAGERGAGARAAAAFGARCIGGTRIGRSLTNGCPQNVTDKHIVDAGLSHC
jgi:chromosome segregation ATPase